MREMPDLRAFANVTTIIDYRGRVRKVRFFSHRFQFVRVGVELETSRKGAKLAKFFICYFLQVFAGPFCCAIA
jgi:hypothetical protein